ncbi:MAG: hypothetical protein KBG02_08195 [Haliscomenobacter sp.]|nr:hypothetical protein [Haliscomenobacter sp.]MBP9076825.1 hypothetical protein [Haliscomenobacter sp.]
MLKFYQWVNLRHYAGVRGRSLIMKYLLLFIGFAGLGVQTFAQSYNTAAGIRLGTDWGLTVRQRVYENITGELILQSSLQREETAITLMGVVHQPLVVRNLNLYVGGGVHKGWTSEAVGTEKLKDPFGIDVMAGVEITISKVNLSWDFKPAINISGGEKTFYSQTGISLRYVLWKREKYEWEKNSNRRKKKNSRK